MKITSEIIALKLAPTLKTNNSLKILLIGMKANSSILMKLEIGEMPQNKQKYLIFIVVTRVRVENTIRLIS